MDEKIEVPSEVSAEVVVPTEFEEELKLAVAHNSKHVVILFEKETSFVALTVESARFVAKALSEHADKLERGEF